MRPFSALCVLVAVTVPACGGRTGLPLGAVDDAGGSSAGGRAGASAVGGATARGGALNQGGAGPGAAGSHNFGGSGGLTTFGGTSSVGGSAEAGQNAGGQSPVAPRLLAPLSTSTVTSQTPRLRWQLAPGTDRAEIDICRDRGCKQPVVAFGAEVAVESMLTPMQLSPGLYYWRARGIVNGTASQEPSSTWQFFVGAKSALVNSSWGTTLDVNGDGFADVLVGAYYANPNHAGAAYLYLGAAGGLSTSPLTIKPPDPSGGEFGYAVASAGDVNGDGFDDVIIGGLSVKSDAGAAYVYLGGPNGLAAVPTTLSSPDGAGSNFSYRLASAGDVNGDGYADVLVSDTFKAGRAGAYLYLGSARGPTTPPIAVAVPAGLNSPFTGAVATAGDINGDGLSDVVIGITDIASGGGEAYVYLGTKAGLSKSPVTLKSPVGPGLGFAPTVACAGDVNADGYADVIVGSQTEAGTVGDGNAYLYFGRAAGIDTTPLVVPIPGGPNGGFGYAVSGAGDLNGDGFGDIVVGAPGAQAGVGFANVYLGSNSGPQSPIALPGFSGLFFGNALAAAGDLDNDGFADLLIGSTGGLAQAGVAALYFGEAGGIGLTPKQLLGSELGSWFGTSVASATSVVRRGGLRRRR